MRVPRFFVPLLLALFGLHAASLTPVRAEDVAWPDEAETPAARPEPRRTRPAPGRAAARPAPHAGPRSAGKAMAPAPSAPARPHKEVPPPKATKDKAAASKSDDDDDDVETIEDVGSVQTKGASAADGNGIEIGAAADAGWTLNKLWGHMHAALVHMPIAWLLAWAGAEALAILWPHPWLLTAGLPIGLMTALSFAPAVYSGLMRLDELAGGESGYDIAPALLHRNLMLAAWTLAVSAVGMRLLRLQARGPRLRRIYLMCVFFGFALLSYSAHLGGVLVYGEDFFPW